MTKLKILSPVYTSDLCIVIEFENEKIITIIVGIIKCCAQSGDRVKIVRGWDFTT